MEDHVSALGHPHYACLYAWLSGSFARELCDVQIAELTSPELTAWLAILEPLPELTAPVTRFRQTVTALQRRPDAQLELAADFAGLFLMTEKSAALPYSSCYQLASSRFKQEPSAQMKALLAQSGMAVESSFGEPEDHLALVVELLSHLNFALTEAGDERRELLKLRNEALIHCLSWLPEFNQRCLSYDKFGFYAALSGLLLALMRLDAGMPMQ
ncbi:molecular chaperone TorD [Serratia liquefaciens]|uniref:molecular chaperone TorD n=1 Tax=Serratia liquefaciens TaxID=614 RepID=UPI0022B9C80D|nr:molecular chaperone TorD [Serratia liquefaciens]